MRPASDRKQPRSLIRSAAEIVRETCAGRRPPAVTLLYNLTLLRYTLINLHRSRNKLLYAKTEPLFNPSRMDAKVNC